MGSVVAYFLQYLYSVGGQLSDKHWPAGEQTAPTFYQSGRQINIQ
jgi:hypothetical protein